jgi:hypothetical protein
MAPAPLLPATEAQVRAIGTADIVVVEWAATEKETSA